MPHIHEQYDFAVTAFIVHDGKVLLVNHPRYGKWLPPGGHVELDEDPVEALLREVAEETGLEVELLGKRPIVESPETKFLVAPDYVDVHEANLPHKHIGLTYFMVAKSDQYKLSSEHTGMRWFTEADIDDPQCNLTGAVRFCMRAAIAKAD